MPEDERWFVAGGTFGPPYPKFSTRSAGESFLIEHGITDYVVDDLMSEFL